MDFYSRQSWRSLQLTFPGLTLLGIDFLLKDCFFHLLDSLWILWIYFFSELFSEHVHFFVLGANDFPEAILTYVSKFGMENLVTGFFTHCIVVSFWKFLLPRRKVFRDLYCVQEVHRRDFLPGGRLSFVLLDLV